MSKNYDKRKSKRTFYNKKLDEATGELMFWGGDGVWIGAPADYLELFGNKPIPLAAPVSVVVVETKVHYKDIVKEGVNCRKLICLADYS